MESDPLDEAIDEALGGTPRAEELAEMIAALEVRRETFGREALSAKDSAAREQWKGRIKEVDRQIEALRSEQAISGFVEGSIRASALRPRPQIDVDELE